MRGLETNVRRLRKQVFIEVANVAYNSVNVNDDIEAVPYLITPGDTPQYCDNIYRERAITRERVRLAMGMSLRPEDKPVHLTQGIDKSDIDEKYYEPPLMQVIPSSCNSCEHNVYEVSNQCKGCVAHPCLEVCPVGAVSMIKGYSVIDQDKCIKCGKCKQHCPYDAISHKRRPCADACGVGAIESDNLGRAKINEDKCVSCGMCMVSCPFGAIADKSQIFQLIRAMQSGRKIVAEIAPAFVGQFGEFASPDKIKAALLKLGFADVYEVALGADMGAIAEANHYVKEVATGHLPFLLTSCCPSWSMLAKKYFPDLINEISSELTPMVATARSIKEKDPEASVVFIGPCAAKKLEASRTSVRSDVDFVITFEELDAMFIARDIEFGDFRTGVPLEETSTAAGRGYAVSGGVASAVKACINEYYPDVEVKVEHAEGLAECKKMLTLAKAGKKNGCLIEGMGCPGGCVAGAGTNIPINKASVAVHNFAKGTKKAIPDNLED